MRRPTRALSLSLSRTMCTTTLFTVTWATASHGKSWLRLNFTGNTFGQFWFARHDIYMIMQFRKICHFIGIFGCWCDDATMWCDGENTKHLEFTWIMHYNANNQHISQIITEFQPNFSNHIRYMYQLCKRYFLRKVSDRMCKPSFACLSVKWSKTMNENKTGGNMWITKYDAFIDILYCDHVFAKKNCFCFGFCFRLSNWHEIKATDMIWTRIFSG